MLESQQDRLDATQLAIKAILANGISPDEIARRVSIAQSTNNPQPEPALAHQPEPVYKKLPEGLIDLPTASKRYGIPVSTMRRWGYRGKLPRLGRLRASAAGGGYIVTE